MFESLVKAPPTVLKNALDNQFGPTVWPALEMETMTLEAGQEFSELLRDKIHVLQIMELDPELFYENMMFFLHSAHVLNNAVTDFETVPIPTSLEIAFAVATVSSLFPNEKHTFSEEIKEVVKHILVQEGYSVAVPPFNMMGISTDQLTPGQTDKDTLDKTHALSLYLKVMNKWPQ